MSREIILYNTEDGTCQFFDSETLAQNYVETHLHQEKLDNGLNRYEIVYVEETDKLSEVEMIIHCATDDNVLSHSTELTDDRMTNREIVDTSEETPIGYMFVEDYEQLKSMGKIEVNTVITPKNIAKTITVLEENGIATDECETVLQAIGYTLLDTELFPNK